jgi:hypothetical protein
METQAIYGNVITEETYPTEITMNEAWAIKDTIEALMNQSYLSSGNNIALFLMMVKEFTANHPQTNIFPIMENYLVINQIALQYKEGLDSAYSKMAKIVQTEL